MQQTWFSSFSFFLWSLPGILHVKPTSSFLLRLYQCQPHTRPSHCAGLGPAVTRQHIQDNIFFDPKTPLLNYVRHVPSCTSPSISITFVFRVVRAHNFSPFSTCELSLLSLRALALLSLNHQHQTLSAKVSDSHSWRTWPPNPLSLSLSLYQHGIWAQW